MKEFCGIFLNLHAIKAIEFRKPDFKSEENTMMCIDGNAYLIKENIYNVKNKFEKFLKESN